MKRRGRVHTLLVGGAAGSMLLAGSRGGSLLLPLALIALYACAGRPHRQPAAPVPILGSLDGAVPVVACTPTQPEQCFDATDNNCNGVIDEGCGVHTGVLQFAVAWEGPVDIDLIVTDPAGEITSGPGESAGGLHKDRDCGTKDDACHGQNVENVYSERDDPPRGAYRVGVHVEKGNGGRFPLRVRLGARIGERSYGQDFLLASSDDERTFQFVVK